MFICLDTSRNVVGLFAVECIKDAFVVDTDEIDENINDTNRNNHFSKKLFVEISVQFIILIKSF